MWLSVAMQSMIVTERICFWIQIVTNLYQLLKHINYKGCHKILEELKKWRIRNMLWNLPLDPPFRVLGLCWDSFGFVKKGNSALILVDNRIFGPVSMRKLFLDRLHLPHLGQIWTYAAANENYYWQYLRSSNSATGQVNNIWGASSLLFCQVQLFILVPAIVCSLTWTN